MPTYCISGIDEKKIQDIILWSKDIFSNGFGNKISKTFVRHQKINLDLKEKEVSAMLAQHCAGAFGVGFIPVVPNAPILVTNEIILLGRILCIYDLQDIKGFLTTGAAATFIGGILTQAGRSLVSIVCKVIQVTAPGVGTLAAGLINGGSASAVTFAFGKSVSKVAKVYCKAIQNNNLAEINNLKQNFGTAVMGLATECIEDGKKTSEDYEKDFDNKEFTFNDIQSSIKKGNEVFQKFLDKNSELDTQFKNIEKDSDKKSDDMWNAINSL